MNPKGMKKPREWQHNGATGSVDSSQCQGKWFVPELLLLFVPSFTCSPHAHIHFWLLEW